MGSTFEAEHQGSEGFEDRRGGWFPTSLHLEEVSERLGLDREEELPTEERVGQHPEHLAGRLEEARLEGAGRQLGWAGRW